MRKAIRLPLLGVTALGALALGSGFPTRQGLTRAQALVSMPGDLVLPTATLQADRVWELAGTPEDAWPLADELVIRYEEIWDQPLEVVYNEAPNLLVLATEELSDEELRVSMEHGVRPAMRASLALTFNAGADGTTEVRVRERYLPEGWLEKVQALVAMKKTYVASVLGSARARRLTAGSAATR